MISEAGIGVKVSKFYSNDSCAYALCASGHLLKVSSIRKTEKVRREICTTIMEMLAQIIWKKGLILLLLFHAVTRLCVKLLPVKPASWISLENNYFLFIGHSVIYCKKPMRIMPKYHFWSGTQHYKLKTECLRHTHIVSNASSCIETNKTKKKVYFRLKLFLPAFYFLSWILNFLPFHFFNSKYK